MLSALYVQSIEESVVNKTDIIAAHTHTHTKSLFKTGCWEYSSVSGCWHNLYKALSSTIGIGHGEEEEEGNDDDDNVDAW